jgi:Chromate transport protein ChrA
VDIRKFPRTTELFFTFALIGLSAVGMGILQAIRSVPVKHGWMSQEEIDEGLGLVQLYPGAIMVDLIAYIGYRLAGIRGSILSVLGFIAPSLVMLLGLSWAYFKYGSHPEVSEIAIGLVALVVGVIINMTIDFAAQHARTPPLAIVAFGSFAIEIAGINVMWAVLGSLLVGGLLFRSLSMTTPIHVEKSEDTKDTLLSGRRLVLSVLPGLAVAAGATQEHSRL